jgi:hypothetical protein
MSISSRLMPSMRNASRLRGGALDTLGRVGFVARGVMYLLIGWITLMIALEHKRTQADRSGALALVASKPFGFVALWFLVVGFGGMALWRAILTVRPSRSEKQGAGARFASACKAVLYAVAAYTTARFAATGHEGGSSNKVSTDFTADAMRHTGGRLLVGAVGAAFVIGGLVLAKRGLSKQVADDLRTRQMTAATRRLVVGLGVAGNIARSVIVIAAGIFLIDAAVTFDPGQARGVDGTLRAFAAVPLGSVVLVLMALGLAAFGVFSFCEARWNKL